MQDDTPLPVYKIGVGGVGGWRWLFGGRGRGVWCGWACASERATTHDEVKDSIGCTSCYLGDMGHVTSVHSPQVEEGDCRYLPREILLDVSRG